MAAPVRVFIGLGANVGDARRTLRDAVAALAGLPGVDLVGVSRLYRTTPVGVTDQPEFLNAVVSLDVATPEAAEANGDIDEAGATGGVDEAEATAGVDAAGAIRLLVQLKDLEREFGRQRRGRWGPRELDLDLLLYGDAQLALERPPAGVPLSASIDPSAANRLLQVPHPSMQDRLFVLAPLRDLDPGLVPPGWTMTVAARADALAKVEPGAVTPVGSWDSTRMDWR